ncbi:endonuclease/exonuclease/phosphatase family protein [Actinoplanes aureus]|uniref:Endonuclease/exonuclease/phosphatase family protein n=1 Tax=Actinoplanes aureus TaxID=2792083 RepID=A0A931C2H5_9ACTN|nr:endonuclease/exonuclease/phosphatase family protein [Actinoplanes aureus]MBG0560147.1 endonuclease/exonuclease/phosphatase family protein [Actinoplanes aureus]
MTWNVWWRFGADWRTRERLIAETVAEHEPDLLGLVESWAADGTDQPHRLAERHGMHAVWAPSGLPPEPEPPENPDQRDVGIGIGLVSRWPIRATEVHDLPNPQRGGVPPRALLATVDHPAGPLHVIVGCTEWEPEYAADHLAQCRALAALATDERLDGALPVLLVGDLNAAPGQIELIPLLDAMVDTWAAGGGDPEAVTLDSAVPYAPAEAVKQIDRRIDHILARPGRPGTSLRISRVFLAGDRPIEGVFPSDHYAVGADLELSPRSLQ